MDKAIEVLELVSPHVKQAESFNVTSESVKVGYKGGKVRSTEVNESSGVAVRAINNGKFGFYASTDLTDLEHLKNSVLVSTEYGGDAKFDLASPTEGASFDGFSDATAKLDIAELIALCQNLTAKIEAINTGNINVDCEIERTTYTQHLVNTNGVNHKQRRTALSMQLVAQRVNGDDVFFTYNGMSGINFDSSFDNIADKLLHELKLSETVVKMDTQEGELPVIFTPLGSYILFLPLMLGLAGKNAFLGVSPIAHKMHEQVLDARITVKEDPLLANSVSSAVFDDEGIPTQPTVYFDKGVLNSFYYDLKSAGEAGVKSNGHGQRSLLGQPGAGMRNPMVMPGDLPFQEMLKDIKEGLLVESVLGMGQTNIMAGEFSNPVSTAFKIQNGEVVGRVKDVSIAGNVYDLLKNKLHSISTEVENIFGQARLPYIRIDRVSTASTT
jgi:PmbA protein